MAIDPWYSSYKGTRPVGSPAREDTPQEHGVRMAKIFAYDLLEGGRPDEGADFRDRVDQHGYVYSWDEEADHGSGAWVQTGKVNPDAKTTNEDFDPERDVHWFDEETVNQEYDDKYYEPQIGPDGENSPPEENNREDNDPEQENQ